MKWTVHFKVEEIGDSLPLVQLLYGYGVFNEGTEPGLSMSCEADVEDFKRMCSEVVKLQAETH